MSPLFFREEDPFAPIEYGYRVEELVCRRKTKHQELVIFKSAYFGRVLVLDGVVQLTEKDEYLYHEMLAHVPLHAHPLPTDILIIGGGDGGTLREVLKHETVKRAVVVEMDTEVVQACREFFPAVAVGFADPRTQLVEMDGAEYLARARGEFDLILVDSTDPVGPAQSLFTTSCFSRAFSALKADGMFVAQTESLHFHGDFVSRVQRGLGEVFGLVKLYTAPLATYAGNWWTFSIASKRHDPEHVRRSCQLPTRYYAEDVHRHAFLPGSLYRRLVEEG